MKKRKIVSLALSGALVFGALAGCGGDQNPQTSPDAQSTGAANNESDAFEITLSIASEPQTIDPALNSAVDGAIMTAHMFEGLMRWEDSGIETAGSDGTCNNAVLGYGQAESYDKVVNDDGTVTYTFHLRDGLKWSDGQDLTAGDFVFSWQRLVDPVTAADYSYMLDCVVNANAIMNGEMEPTELGVSAPDDTTFVVTITSDLPYFPELCAFPAMFPVREDVVSNPEWTYSPETYISNGAYKMTARETNAQIVMEPNEYYYGVDELGPDKITFKLMDDQTAQLNGYNSGELDFIETVPVDEVAGLLASGDMKVVDQLGIYYISFQNQKAPFDDWRVRKAFTLAMDRNYIVSEITQTGQVEAGGFVPAGVYDAEGVEGDDFRTVGGDYYDPSAEAYEANCEEARALLAEAGYPNGEGFPVVEYLYNTDDNHKAIAEALQNMWQTELGVTVTLNNQEWGTYLETRKNGEFSICRDAWVADYNDPMNFLDMFLSGGGNNNPQYASETFDAKIAEAKATSDVATRMQLIHEAEDILVGQDYAVAPLYFYTQSYLLADGIQGLYYSPLGYFFFDHCTQG